MVGWKSGEGLRSGQEAEQEMAAGVPALAETLEQYWAELAWVDSQIGDVAAGLESKRESVVDLEKELRLLMEQRSELAQALSLPPGLKEQALRVVGQVRPRP